MKTEEPDIVYVEAFNVLKKEFLSHINHSSDNIGECFGLGERKGSNKEYEYFMELVRMNEISRALEKILIDSKTFGDFIFNLYLFSTFSTKLEMTMSSMRNPFEEITSTLQKMVDDIEKRKRNENR